MWRVHWLRFRELVSCVLLLRMMRLDYYVQAYVLKVLLCFWSLKPCIIQWMRQPLFLMISKSLLVRLVYVGKEVIWVLSRTGIRLTFVWRWPIVWQKKAGEMLKLLIFVPWSRWIKRLYLRLFGKQAKYLSCMRIRYFLVSGQSWLQLSGLRCSVI